VSLRKAGVVLLCNVVLTPFLLTGAQPALASAYPIESHYSQPGPSRVSTSSASDSTGATYDLYYPADLASLPQLPLLTWGDGTNAPPTSYPGVLDQLASWRFVVVASTCLNCGTGAEMLAGVNYMLGKNGDPTSPFYGRIDTAEIGALGHSQGAGGAVNATNNSGGLIKTDDPICLPAQKWVAPSTQFDVSALRVPTMFLGGSADPVIAPPSALQGYYAQVPGPAALLILKGAGHLTIENTGGGYLGYLTAWFRYILDADSYARGAFVGSPPEANVNRSWVDVAEKNLP